MKKYLTLTSLLATLLASLLSIQHSYADSNLQIQAATGCFPRVFSQINFFKSSNGALRNDSATPKTVVCAVHITDQNNDDHTALTLDDQLYIGLYFSFNNSLADIPCTLYMRDGTSNTSIEESDSAVITFTGPSRFYSWLTVDRVNNAGNVNHSYNYFQCTLPAGAAISHYNVFNY